MAFFFINFPLRLCQQTRMRWTRWLETNITRINGAKIPLRKLSETWHHQSLCFTYLSSEKFTANPFTTWKFRKRSSIVGYQPKQYNTYYARLKIHEFLMPITEWIGDVRLLPAKTVVADWLDLIAVFRERGWRGLYVYTTQLSNTSSFNGRQVIPKRSMLDFSRKTLINLCISENRDSGCTITNPNTPVQSFFSWKENEISRKWSKNVTCHAV